MAEESAISRTGAMLGLRLPAPFSVGKLSLLLSSGGSGFWRSIATVPENYMWLLYEQQFIRLFRINIHSIFTVMCCCQQGMFEHKCHGEANDYFISENTLVLENVFSNWMYNKRVHV